MSARPKFVQPEKWYFVVNCGKCGNPIPFAQAPSPEDDPTPKYRKVSELRCPFCQFVGEYAPALMSRRQGPEKRQSEPPAAPRPLSNTQKPSLSSADSMREKKRIGDSLHRGIEYGIHRDEHGDWHWAYYPKVEQGTVEKGTVKGTREMAISACRAAIDKWLGPEKYDPH
jgi:hypothetical protein